MIGNLGFGVRIQQLVVIYVKTCYNIMHSQHERMKTLTEFIVCTRITECYLVCG